MGLPRRREARRGLGRARRPRPRSCLPRCRRVHRRVHRRAPAARRRLGGRGRCRLRPARHRLASDPRVTVLDRTNARHLTSAVVPGPAPDLVVADLSFISLTLVLPALVAVRCAWRRPRAAREAAVRGRPAAPSAAAVSCATPRRAARPSRGSPTPRSRSAAWFKARQIRRCPAPRATSSASCTCAAVHNADRVRSGPCHHEPRCWRSCGSATSGSSRTSRWRWPPGSTS